MQKNYKKYLSHKCLFLFLISLMIPHHTLTVGFPSKNDVSSFLNDPYTRLVLTTVGFFAPLILQKYNVFQDEKIIQQKYALLEYEIISDRQTTEANTKKLEKLDIENAQERLAILYRSKELIDDYAVYINKISKDQATEKKEANEIYTHLILKYGKSLEVILNANKEAIEKIESDYQAAVNNQAKV